MLTGFYILFCKIWKMSYKIEELLLLISVDIFYIALIRLLWNTIS